MVSVAEQSVASAVKGCELSRETRRVTSAELLGAYGGLSFWQSWAIKSQVIILEPGTCRHFQEPTIYPGLWAWNCFIKYDSSFVPLSNSKHNRGCCLKMTLRKVNEPQEMADFSKWGKPSL